MTSRVKNNNTPSEAFSCNISKTKILVFRKRGRLPDNLQFIYKGNIIEIVTKFCYLGIVFTSGGSSFETQKPFQDKR